MKSNPYKLHGKLFRYDFDRCVVEYIAKADAEMVADDADGYMILDTVGLHKDNWTNKEAREEYLSEWAFELDEEYLSEWAFELDEEGLH